MQFEWDEFNLREVAAHDVTPAEFEQVMDSDPVWLDSHMVGDEQREVGVGHTVAFRILIVVWVERSEARIRPVTGYEANARVRRSYRNMER